MKIIETISKEEKIELIKEMAMYYIENKDMTLVELADTYGRPYSTVYNWLTYQLPKIDMELYNHFRNSMKGEQKEHQYSTGSVKRARKYSCLPIILSNLDFSARVTILHQIVCTNHTIPDWDEVTDILFHDIKSHGFNLLTSVNSYKDLKKLYKLVDFAIKNPHSGKWHKRKCKTCGKIFTLHLSNYRFFSEDGMYLPNNCFQCRQKKRRNRYETV